ncbi:hypothetical protein DJ568_02580 [Mucilaginibacter hurinus]|uniref:Thioredoxin domain-containing protein n=1 Tax=Mucilaginibacter hurinus TaxID=2201324 RepID=A0A367GTY7_9SPHI|nr:TlpA disulfide reductase family protein [Mucilaginibacter hurinus]RCH56760.1 hypothetical protein DJ568_02580 [Mucilaginibacter hurinus]
MKTVNLTLLICVICITNTFAQAQIIQKVIDKISGCKSISYNSTSMSLNPFDGNIDTSHYSAGFYNLAADGRYAMYYIFTNRNSGKYKYIYQNKNLISIDFQQSNYRFEKDYTSGSYDSSPMAIIDNLAEYLKNDKYKLTQLADTRIKNIGCSHVYLMLEDTLKSSYFKYHIFISKADNDIIYLRKALQGEMLKGGMSLGLFKMESEQYFTNYKFNAAWPRDNVFSIPDGFTEEVSKTTLTPGLRKGTVAPRLELKSTENELLVMEKLKGKVVLLDFTSINCPACMLAVKALKNLHQKYKASDVEIVTINTLDTRDAISKFRKLNNITTPIYADGKEAAKAYNTYGTPNFYIINKQGEIVEYYDGFFKNFEQTVSARIEELR